MKKNKGFTLVELLAVIVILGLLITLSVPLIFKYTKSSKNNAYVSDASKLISLAEYKMKSKSTNIKTPDYGNCIVLGFNYLDDGSFTNPPGKGSYYGPASFITVKNNDGKLEYYVTLVENVKNSDGYVGIRFVSQNSIKNDSADSLVKTYTNDELVYISKEACDKYNVNSCNSVLSADIIKDFLNIESDIELNIEKIYLNDDGVRAIQADGFPRFLNASVHSVQNQDYNKRTLEVNVNAVDGTRAVDPKMRVGIYVSENIIDDNFKFESDITDNSCKANDKDYCIFENYTKAVNETFSFVIDVENWTEDHYIYVYLVIYCYDADNKVKNHISTIFKESILYDNNPYLEASVESKDKLNGYDTSIVINAIDDKTTSDNLLFCVNYEDISDYENKGFKKENMSCSEDGLCRYDFQIDKKYKPGDSVPIYVFVKDEKGNESKVPLSYTLSSELSNNLDVKVDRFACIADPFNLNPQFNSLTGHYELDITNKLYSNSKISLKFSGDVDEKTMTLSEFYGANENDISNRLFSFKNQDYDGRDRHISLTVSYNDSDGNPHSIDSSCTVDNIYTRTAPQISNFSIIDDSIDNCYAEDCSGSTDVKVSFNAVDLEYSFEQLEYCLSDNINQCNNSNNYNSCSEIENHVVPFKFSGNYNDGGSKTLRLCVRNIYGSSCSNLNYELYKNKKPEIIDSSYEIQSVIDSRNSNEVKVIFDNFNVYDDFNDYKINICYYTDSDNPNEICKVLKDSSLNDGEVIDFTFVDNYGNDLENTDVFTKIKIIDNQNNNLFTMTTNPVSYKIDPLPKILKTEIQSSSDSFNSRFFNVYFNVYDPGHDYKVCISKDPNSECGYSEGNIIGEGPFVGSNDINSNEIGNNFVSYAYEPENGVINKDFYNGYSPNLYLIVVDDTGIRNYAMINQEYKIYNACSDKHVDDFNISLSTNYTQQNEITHVLCGGKCIKSNSINSDIVSYYDITKKFVDNHLFNVSSNSELVQESWTDYPLSCGEEKVKEQAVTCDSSQCISSAMHEDENTYMNIIGTTRINSPEPFLEEYQRGDGTTITRYCTSYYNRYIGIFKYNDVTYYKLSNDQYRVCADLIDTKYAYDENAYSPYLRVDDSNFVNGNS